MKILCVGAAGSGVGAIVRWHLRLGDVVYVVDHFTESAELLKKYPGAIAWSDGSSLDLAVFSDAVPQGHLLRHEMIARKIPMRGFAEELGALCVARRVIAVAGTHGKSTTTALLSWIFASAGRDPLCFIGAEMPTWPSGVGSGGFRYGAGPVIVEADEYKKHFLNLAPETIVITSLEMDHFDIYPDEKELLKTFVDFCMRPATKSVFMGRGQLLLDQLAGQVHSATRFGSSEDIIYCKDFRIEWGIAYVKLSLNGKEHEFIFQATTSPHISNVLSAVIVSLKEGIPLAEIQKVVGSFPGILRRMEKLGAIGTVPVYSDYAHHATAVRETLAMAKKIWPDATIAAIFEPHERLRTSRLRTEYASAFSPADQIGLLPVYEPRGRERIDVPEEAYSLSISGNVERLADYAAAIAWAKTFAAQNPKGIIMVMGAGPVDGAFRKVLL